MSHGWYIGCFAEEGPCRQKYQIQWKKFLSVDSNKITGERVTAASLCIQVQAGALGHTSTMEISWHMLVERDGCVNCNRVDHFCNWKKGVDNSIPAMQHRSA